MSCGVEYGQSTGDAASSPAVQAYRWPKVVFNFLAEPKKDRAGSISSSELTLLEDGRPQTVQSIAGPGSPVSLCILLDISGSMTSKAKYAHDAALALVQHLPAGSEVMVVTFAEESYLTVPMTPVASFDPHALDHLSVGHRTALYDSLITSEEFFAQYTHFPRRALVLIGDGGNSRSQHGFGDAKRAVQTAGGPFVYVLGSFDPYAATPEERQVPLDLESMHALMIRESDLQDLPKRAEEIARLIDSQYAFTYTSSRAIGDKRFHKLEIKLPASNRDAKIESLPGFFIPGK